VVPAVDQIEVPPFFRQAAVLTKDAERGILSQAWSPIGGITFYPGWGENRMSRLHEPVTLSIAEAHGKSAAQV
jgi:2,5-diketo-D-gluconate reductase A